ncbi:hypothetical protein GCM10007858_37300 [Bradyrhizobium liaoningense]|nr:hypothetical protein GCM10007858_37300 [Bradyrhizobium liaoningense]
MFSDRLIRRIEVQGAETALRPRVAQIAITGSMCRTDYRTHIAASAVQSLQGRFNNRRGEVR